MDLVGAECKRSGVRGGRNQFTWDSVKRNEREYYLGNSVANRTMPWSLPKTESSEVPASSVHASTRIPSAFSERQTEPRHDSTVDTIRRREKAMLDAALCGSFADAVRSALAESGDSDVDEERGSSKVEDKDKKKEEKEERRKRKAERKRIRELRRKRRAERAGKRARDGQDEYATGDSSESERESQRCRIPSDTDKPRRKRERESSKRKRLHSSEEEELYRELHSAKIRRERPRY